MNSSRPNPNYKIVGETIRKKHEGESISDAELNVTIDTLESLLDFIFDLGPQFHLFWRSLNEDLMDFKGYQRARKDKPL